MLSVLRWFGILACCLLCGGCWPSAQAPLDEQKESNFLTGKARTQDRDYDGAIEAFEKALEANPHSASAYFELAVIYDQHKNDYAAALYHYEKARRLRPNAYPADIAKDRLEVCKRELAKTVTQTPTMEYMQREIDRLMLENQRLRQALQEWQNYYQGRSSVMPNPNTNVLPTPAPAPVARQATSAPSVTRVDAVRAAPHNSDPPPGPVTAAVSSQRTHKIAAGDTPGKIATKYGIKVSSLHAANPGLDDRHLHVGQVLVIPAQ